MDPSDPVQVMFSEVSKVLDARHDKRERVVKISRDITIESKRIIFNLHRIKCEQDKNTVLAEVESRFSNLKFGPWYHLACELQGQDHYQLVRAYSGGLQEWVEALSFYHYLCYDKIITFEQVQTELSWPHKKAKVKVDAPSKEKEIQDVGGENVSNNEEKSSEPSSTVTKSVEEVLTEDIANLSVDQLSIPPPLMVTVPQTEYIMGLADLTGELMRNAINSLASGNMEACFTLLSVLQAVGEGFDRLDRKECPRDIHSKVKVLKQSLKKVEGACYAISVRGSEIPKNHLADIFSQEEARPGHQGEEDVAFYSD